MIYLDYNSHKPIDKQIALQLTDILHYPLNPSGMHFAAKNAKKLMNQSIDKIKASTKAHCHDICFCSSGTEAVNMAFNTLSFDNIFCLETDHECAINNPKSQFITVDANGIIDLNNLQKTLHKHKNQCNLISFCLANNQTGVLQPIEEIIKIVREYQNCYIHGDAVQFATKSLMQINLDSFDFDFLSVSSHKIGALSGSGFLLYKSEFDIKPIFYGGGQQQFKRAGTENLLGIISCGLAFEKFNNQQYISQYTTHTATLQKSLEDFLVANDCIIFCQNAKRLTNTTFYSMPNCSSEIQLVEYDLNKICVSAGSACSSGKASISHVLLASGIDKNIAKNAIRVSIDILTTQNDIDKFCEVFTALKKRL